MGQSRRCEALVCGDQAVLVVDDEDNGVGLLERDLSLLRCQHPQLTGVTSEPTGIYNQKGRAVVLAESVATIACEPREIGDESVSRAS